MKTPVFYTKEADGTIQKWFWFAGYGDEFAVATVANAKRYHHKRYYNRSDIGHAIFNTRKEAQGGAAK